VVTVVTLFILLRVVPFFNYPVQEAAVPVDILTQLGTRWWAISCCRLRWLRCCCWPRDRRDLHCA